MQHLEGVVSRKFPIITMNCTKWLVGIYMFDPLGFIIGYVLLIFERKNEQGELGA